MPYQSRSASPRRNSYRKITACSMLAAALGSLSAPIVTTTGILGFLAEDSVARGDDSDLRTKAHTLRLMSKAISLDVQDQPLEEIIDYIMDVTNAELEPVYLDSISSTGMDPETLITLRATEVPAISLLERILKKAERIESIGEEYTWQFTDIGSIQCGPKSVLNEDQRIEIYDIADLLLVIPSFDNAPNFNISGGGGGGGGGGGRSSPFSGSSGDVDIESSAERSTSLISLIESSVEPDQWESAGGNGATMTTYGTSLVITAPDYIHRQIAGYEFWPSRLHTIKARGNQRSIQIKPDPKAKFSSP